MKRATFKYVAALALFGSNGIVASHISLSSYQIVFTRTLLGALLLALVFAFSREKRQFGHNASHSLCLTVSGAAMGASWLFLFEAYKQVGVSIATLAYYCGPMIVMAVSPLVFKEKITGIKLVGLLSVVSGMFLASQRELSAGHVSWGLVFGILAAFAYAVMVVFNRKATSIAGIENPMWQLIVSFLTVALVTGVKEGFTFPVATANIVPVLILGVINTGVGCYLYFSAINDIPVQTVAILGYLEPLSALLFSALFLGEILDGGQLLGVALVLGGAACGGLRPPSLLKGRACWRLGVRYDNEEGGSCFPISKGAP
ncbi:DMT family transporter [Geomonas sp. Red32]|uniref:DMT family transporter n=1 Tax=Geomonas sp. Red32 TaxID=2912856 RepID=UPI00202CB366|nr:DMT family transporter [Geomonas sp. Red32]MCM0082274.1 DMT family transporter [Geomonas sp. Red32]